MASQGNRCAECECEHIPGGPNTRLAGYFALQPGTHTLLCGKCLRMSNKDLT